VFRGVLLAVLVAVPVVLTLVATASGVGISPDSVSYVSAARSLATAGDLISYTGEPLTLFPPGLSVLLGSAQWLGWSAESAAVVLNALCGALLVLATYALGRRALRSDWATLCAAAFVSLSSTTVTVLAMVWSEPLFAVLAMGALLLLSGAIARGVITIRLIVLVGVAVSLATAVRYVGFVLVPVAGLGAWLAMRAHPSRMRWRSVLLVMLASSAGLVVVMMRNAALGSGLLGERYPAARSLQGAIADTVVQLGSYVAPPESTMLTAEAGVVVMVFLMTGAWLAVTRRNAQMTLIAGYVAVYWVAMLWSQATTRLDTATDRLAFPAFAPMVILVVYGVWSVTTAIVDQAERFTAASASPRLRRRGAVVARVVLWSGVAVVAVGAVTISLVHGVRFARAAGEDGLFLASAASQASPLAQAARDLPGAPGLASNDPWHVYWVVGHSPVLHLPPDPAEWPAQRVADDLALLSARVADGTVTHVAAFTDGQAFLSPAVLEGEGLALTEVAAYPDGTLYRVAEAAG
jgi:4-amino-4-deoxy-L-arabinose transferase-like glycosyltransferase